MLTGTTPRDGDLSTAMHVHSADCDSVARLIQRDDVFSGTP
jgi:hypothetical protein